MKIGNMVIVGCVLFAGIFAALFYPAATVEPVFKGKTISNWVYNFGGSDECSEAVRHFGTNALPDIRNALRVRNTAARRAMVWLAGHQKVLKLPIASAQDVHFSALFAYKEILELVHERWLPPEIADTCGSEIRALAVEGGIDESNACVDVLAGIEFVKTHAWSSPPPIEDNDIERVQRR